MKIEIINWDKYNPRKDLKSMSWFRLESNIAVDPKLHSLTVEGRWLWVCLLSIAAQQMAASFDVDISYLSRISGVKEKSIKAELKKLEGKQLVHVSVRNMNESVRATNENVPNEHNEHNEHNTHAQNDLSDSVSKSDLEEFLQDHYERYPRKQGKAKGLERLRRNLKTLGDLGDFSRAVFHYCEHCDLNNLEPRFIMHFSTFANQWRDWINEETVQRLERRSV